MSFLGTWEIDDLLTFPAITHRFDTGALTDADSVPAYRVYEDETGTAILTGSMAKLDDAGTTGFYSEQLTLSAANGFEVGKSYSIYITAAVNSVTGGSHHTFKVELAPATAAALTIIDGIVDDILVDTAEIGTAGAGLTNINLPNQTMDIVGNITGNLSGSVDSVTGAVGSVTGAVGSVTALAANSVTASALATDAVSEIADGILDRNMATGTDSGSTTVRTMRQALRFLRNKWSISGGTLTVTKEDDSTSSWTAALGTDAAADPVVSSDPAGP